MRIKIIAIVGLMVFFLHSMCVRASEVLDSFVCSARDNYEYSVSSSYSWNGLDYDYGVWFSQNPDCDGSILGLLDRLDNGRFVVRISLYGEDGATVPKALAVHYESFQNGHVLSHIKSDKEDSLEISVGVGHYDLSGISFPVFSNMDDLMSFLDSGDDSGQLNKLIADDPPVEAHFKDSYYFRNFKLANLVMDQSVHASWSGLSFPETYTDDMISSVTAQKVVVSMGYCLKDYPTQVAYVKYYPYSFDVSAGSLDIPVSVLQPSSADEYLFYVQVTPVIWHGGQYFHGSKSNVYFSWDGSVDHVVTNTGNANHTTISAPMPNNTWPSGSGSGADSSITNAFDTAISTMQSMYNSISTGVLPLIKLCFSFFPPWLSGAICAAIIICIVLAIYHGVRG